MKKEAESLHISQQSTNFFKFWYSLKSSVKAFKLYSHKVILNNGHNINNIIRTRLKDQLITFIKTRPHVYVNNQIQNRGAYSISNSTRSLKTRWHRALTDKNNNMEHPN